MATGKKSPKKGPKAKPAKKQKKKKGTKRKPAADALPGLVSGERGVVSEATAESEVRILVAHFIDGDPDPDSLDLTDQLGDGGYGFSKQRLQTLAKPLSEISKALGGSSISMTAVAKAKTLGDLVKLVESAIR